MYNLFVYNKKNLNTDLIDCLYETFCSIQLREILWYIVFYKKIKKTHELYQVLCDLKILDTSGNFILNKEILRDNILFVINSKQQLYKIHEGFNFENFNKKTIMFLRFVKIKLLYNIINENDIEKRRVLISSLFKKKDITNLRCNYYLDNIIIFLMMM